ncbi:MAG: Fe-S-containing hydro-lyase [bacterium]|nr:Fe-S-containing hydro-lyase [bacterium]
MNGERVIRLETPLNPKAVADLRAGDAVLLSGIVYTARDAAHKRMIEALREGEELPFPLEGETIYYAGPSPAPPGRPVGSIGPTTSCRMDRFTSRLITAGLRGMIGKGERSPEVATTLRRCGAVYLAAIGGAAALLARSVISARVVAYEDLGTEAVRRLEIKDMPLIVALDIHGGDIYQQEKERYRR